MKILHILPGLEKASGVTVFAVNLVREIEGLGEECEVCTSFASSRLKIMEGVDLVHIHGLWWPWFFKMSRIALRRGVPIVWSPHGMLQKWALKNKWWKKIVGLSLYQWWGLRSAALLHATAESEVEDIRRLGLKNKVVIAPLGVGIDKGVAKMNGEKRTLLFVSRVQRKKGLPNLVAAWSLLPAEIRKDWSVRIVGPDEDGHVAELKAQCAKCKVMDDFHFRGPKYDEELECEYLNADLFVLPTHSENFGSVVIEALARGVPVITTKEAPWVELEEHKCGWWIEDSVAALCDALKTAMTLPREDLRMMGSRGVSLVKDKYTWESAARTMLNAYKEVINGSQVA